MNSPRTRYLVAATLCAIAASLTLSAISDASSTSTPISTAGCLPYQPHRCPADHLAALTDDTPSTSTTSTTIDLSFLNTTTTSRPAPTPAPEPTVNPEPSSLSDVWDQVAQCETGGNWQTNTGNGYGGGLQFAHSPGWSTWRAYGGEEFSAHPWDATREEQIVIAERVLAGSGWRAWPGCARKIGLL